MNSINIVNKKNNKIQDLSLIKINNNKTIYNKFEI